MQLRALALTAISFALVPGAAHAASPAPAASTASAPAPCSSPEDRQFDFWAGRWNVTDRVTGKPVGTNDITRELHGCVLHEHWSGTGGGNGMSFNHYDAARKLWHQTWVDDGGGILYLDGALRNGSMVLSGKRTTRKGNRIVDRITYTPRPDGSVRQWWQVSRDGGATWATSFDGIYRKAE